MPDLEIVTMIAIINMSELIVFGLILLGVSWFPAIGHKVDKLVLALENH